LSSIRFTGVALTGLLTLGIAATSVAAPRAAVKPTKVACRLAIAEQVPAGATGINPADTQGTEFGTTACGKVLGSGVAVLPFTVPSDGSLRGTFHDYFATGTIHGKYVLIPGNSAPSSPSTFATERFTGTVTVSGGTGAYEGAKGTGTLRCVTTDAVHYSCVEHLRLAQL
jgi:hypothetical protein